MEYGGAEKAANDQRGQVRLLLQREMGKKKNYRDRLEREIEREREYG